MKPERLVQSLLTFVEEEEQRDFVAQHRTAFTLAVFEEFKRVSAQYYHHAPQRALEIARLAMRVATWLGDPLYRAKALWIEANALFFLERYQEAVARYEEAVAIYERYGRELEIAQLRVGQVFALAYLSRFDEALGMAEQIRSILEHRNERYRLAMLELNVGAVYDLMERYEEALEAYGRARAILVELQRPFDVARVDLNRALALLNLDRFTEALSLYKASRAEFAKQGQVLEVARADLNIALLETRRGRYAEALAAYDRARSGFSQLDVPIQLAETDLYESLVHLALNCFSEANTLCERALRVFQEQGLRREMALAQWNQALACLGLGDRWKAKRLLRASEKALRALGLEFQAAAVALERAALQLDEGQPAKALELARRVRKAFKKANLAVQSAQADIVIGRSQMALGQWDEARSSFRRALNVAQKQGVCWLLYPCHYGLARIAELSQEWDEARRHYEQALEAVESAGGQLMGIDLRATFLQDKRPGYAGLAWLLLQQGKVEEAFATLERARAQTLVDLLAHSFPLLPHPDDPSTQELERRLRALEESWNWMVSKMEPLFQRALEREPSTRQIVMADYHALREQELEIAALRRRLRGSLFSYDRPSVDELCRVLNPEALLIVYSVARGQVLAFLLEAEGLRGWTDLGPVTEVERALNILRANLRGFPFLDATYRRGHGAALIRAVRGPLEALYRMLFAPLANMAITHRWLIIVPDDILYYVPFHALFDGKDYLLDRWEVTYLPGASVLALWKQRTSVKGQGALVLGYSAGGALPHVTAEAQAVLNSLPHTTVYLDREATIARLSREGHRYRVVHLATHGVSRPDNPLFSFLELADGRLTVNAVYDLQLPAQLVVLSGCETGAGGLRGGDLLGLTRGFMHAGVPSLVVSLWGVYDEATAVLMREFYRQLSGGRRVGEALRLAQLTLREHQSIHKGTPVRPYEHPYYWASFVMVGRDMPLQLG